MIAHLPPRIRRFFQILFLVTGVAHAVFAVALAEGLARLGVPLAPWLAVALAALLFYLFRGRVAQAIDDRQLPRWRRLLVEEPYYAHWCATLLGAVLFFPSLVVLAVRTLVTGAPFALGAAGLDIYLFALALSSWGVFVRRRWVVVRRVDVDVRGLPAAFEGYRIAQLSDLHIGSMDPRERALGWVTRANGLDADLVVLTGDYVTNGVAFHEDIAEVLGGLRARDGVIAILGNHDYFGEGEPMISMLRARGVKVLRNQSTVVERDGASLGVAGVDDAWTGRADPEKATLGAVRPLVVLSHDPKLFPALANLGASLVLSGHTHWGQVGVPFMKRWSLGSFSYRFHAGLYRLDDATLYVNAGLGTTGPPIRLGAAPEITLLRLRRARAT